ncbi:hypothetical protein AIT68_005019 [Salmonella enterica subsp. salamae]|uniref:hypothetical protein n=1 Tax=Salmonella enterica TaxID=28901 RepID=UPI0012B84251|nr:hypothetical protein [Salmonella enterica]
MEQRRPFSEILSWRVSEMQFWQAHYQLEYEKEHPPVVNPADVTPEQSLAQFKKLMV